MKLRRFGAERVPGYERGLLDQDLESAARAGSPYTTMLGAKRAIAGPRHNFERIRLKRKQERDISAVARTMNQHKSGLRCCRTSGIPTKDDGPLNQPCLIHVFNSVEYPTNPDL